MLENILFSASPSVTLGQLQKYDLSVFKTTEELDEKIKDAKKAL